jgi:sec-independent protein translocase protein TatC
MNEISPEVLPQDSPIPFWDHISELRDRLIRSALALLLSTMAAYFFRLRLWDLAKRPLLAAMAAREHMPAASLHPFAFTDLAEPFFALMRLSFWAAVFVVSPYLFYQVWTFVRPALREQERKMAVAFVAVTSLCFMSGAVFSYFMIFPILGDLLLAEAVSAGLRANLRPSEYLDLFIYTVVGTGLSFETPVLFYFLARFRLVSARAMYKHWREATLAILLASSFLTPGDVLATTILFGAVLLTLYFLSAGVVLLVERSRRDD